MGFRVGLVSIDSNHHFHSSSAAWNARSAEMGSCALPADQVEKTPMPGNLIFHRDSAQAPVPAFARL